MASFFDRFRSLISSKSQNTNSEYNKAIYNWLGNTIVWNTENDQTYINDGYRKNATVYSLVNIISSLFCTKSKKLFLCLSTQNLSDKDIADLLVSASALSKAFFGSPSSHK